MSGLARISGALVVIASVMGLAEILGCQGRNPNHGVERHIAERLSRALRMQVGSLACPTDGDVRAGFVCSGTLRSGQPFVVDVSGIDPAGQPTWKVRGALNFEYQIALGFARAARGRPAAVACPRSGDLKAGFECQITLDDGHTTPVWVTASDRADRFVWRAGEVLMLGAIEEQIQLDLDRRDRTASVDCGRVLQKSVPGHSFDCAIQFGDGKSGSATVWIVDADGRIQYRVSAHPPGAE